jgi:hypothetical protein
VAETNCGKKESSRALTFMVADRAIDSTLESSQQSLKQAFEKAVKSNQPTAKFREVLTACALARADESGFFTQTAVRGPLSQMLGRNIEIGQPWQLADVRPRVCYVGLVFKQDPSPAEKGEACCAAQMFLNSGNGIVFRGALGPWYSEEKREFHLRREAARDLVSEVLKSYEKDHGAPPAELFIHARQRFEDEEWNGFTSAVDPRKTQLVGVRIRTTQDLRLFRPFADVPVLRGTAVTMSKREGYLWTTGYVPRLRTYPGFETPKPILIEVNRGEGDLKTVMADVLALTKVNYNACDYASGLPVTLKFADRVGEILTASPRGLQAPPLPFRFYI